MSYNTYVSLNVRCQIAHRIKSWLFPPVPLTDSGVWSLRAENDGFSTGCAKFISSQLKGNWCSRWWPHYKQVEDSMSSSSTSDSEKDAFLCQYLNFFKPHKITTRKEMYPNDSKNWKENKPWWYWICFYMFTTVPGRMFSI